MMKFISNLLVVLISLSAMASIGFSQELHEDVDVEPCAEMVQVYRKGACMSAILWLTYLRNGTDQYEHLTQYVREELEAGGLTLADIRSSEDELTQLQVLGAKTAAAEWLHFLRNGTTQYAAFEKYVYKELVAFDLTLEDIGTSKKELAELRVKGAKKAATEWLKYLRDGTEQYVYLAQYVRDELKAGGLTLEDIGSSEFELQEYQAKR